MKASKAQGRCNATRGAVTEDSFAALTQIAALGRSKINPRVTLGERLPFLRADETTSGK
jgi:hypothetical protein